MYDELTEQDIQKMREELDERSGLLPELLEEVKRTRAFGDLSENFEYKAAKQALNRSRSRIRYLERMIKTARIIEDRSGGGEVGLFDEVGIYIPEDGEEQTVRVVTTVRCNPLEGFVSREAPLGRALLGRRAGERVTVKVSEQYEYEVEIRSVKKGSDDGSAPLLEY